MNLPNKLTVLRICMIPLFLVAYLLPYDWAPIVAVGIFVLAASTDFLDGYIARKYNLVTDLGKFLDPIADKILVAVALVCIVASNPLQWYNYLSANQIKGVDIFTWCLLIGCVSLIFAREFTVDALRMVAANKKVVVQANIFGKIKTVLQDITLALLIIMHHGCYEAQMLSFISYRGPELGLWYRICWYIAIVLLVLTTIATVVSGVIYIVKHKSVFVSNSEVENS